MKPYSILNTCGLNPNYSTQRRKQISSISWNTISEDKLHSFVFLTLTLKIPVTKYREGGKHPKFFHIIILTLTRLVRGYYITKASSRWGMWMTFGDHYNFICWTRLVQAASWGWAMAQLRLRKFDCCLKLSYFKF